MPIVQDIVDCCGNRQIFNYDSKILAEGVALILKPKGWLFLWFEQESRDKTQGLHTENSRTFQDLRSQYCHSRLRQLRIRVLIFKKNAGVSVGYFAGPQKRRKGGIFEGTSSKSLTRDPWALTLWLRTNLAIGKKIQELHILFLCTEGGSILSLFSLYGHRFPIYRQIFKITIFGNETWPLAKVPEVAHILSFYPYGV